MSMKNRMTTEEWFQFQEDTFNDIVQLTRSKNADYTGGTDDPFANFRGSEAFGVHRLAGLAIRMDDKFQRVKAYLNRGELKVVDEGIEDAFKDIIGYAVLALGMLEEDKEPTSGDGWVVRDLGFDESDDYNEDDDEGFMLYGKTVRSNGYE